MAGTSAERQETGVVNNINKVSLNGKNPITVRSRNGTKVNKVLKAFKYEGRQITGSEPYIDVVFEQRFRNITKNIGLSLKGESAPSLAGGGLRGINLAVPGLADKFMIAAWESLQKDGYEKGDKIPDVYAEIKERNKTKIVVGNKAMGGPIDFMYIGPMSVQARYEDKKNILQLNGDIIEAERYAKTHKLFFRLRVRRHDQRFDPDAFDNRGIPTVYGRSKSRGDRSGRISVADKVPSTALLIRFR